MEKWRENICDLFQRQLKREAVLLQLNDKLSTQLTHWIKLHYLHDLHILTGRSSTQIDTGRDHISANNKQKHQSLKRSYKIKFKKILLSRRFSEGMHFSLLTPNTVVLLGRANKEKKLLSIRGRKLLIILEARMSCKYYSPAN